MTKTKAIDIIGAPSTFGQRKLGVDLGPTAIRYATYNINCFCLCHKRPPLLYVIKE
jgi:arginase family enzyme